MQRGHEWYIPVTQAAEMIECNWRTVYEMMKSGTLKWVRTPRDHIAVSVDSITHYLENTIRDAGSGMRAESANPHCHRSWAASGHDDYLENRSEVS
jgi:hypothetical protein